MSRYQKVLAVLFCMLILFVVAPTGGAYAQTEGPFGEPTCSDLIDNDGDGKKDAADTDCYNIVGDPAVDDDGDGRTENDGDCNDDDATVYAGAQKICDGKDNNCDGKKDFTTDEDKDNDGVPWCAGDCDDNNPNRAPNILEAPEGSPVCTDGIDNDCDNKADSVDPGCQFSCFDSDGDGYGINGDPSCTGTGIDCNDNDATVNPGVTDDSCNGVDNNCSTVIDDEYVIDTLCGTGECQANNTPSSCVAGVETLCQPGTPVYEGPQGDGTCSGGLDEDCDNLIDGNDPGCNTLCIDQDGDGYGSNGHASCPNGPAVDCDDTNAAVNPAGDDANCNGIDEDCAGGADDGYVPDALCGTGLCQTTNTPGSCTGGVETACQPGSPVAEDTPGVGVCTDGVDNDCDGLTDAADSEGCSSLDVDDDGDGYTENQNDCNDGDPTMYPGAPKICDGKDNNCDGKKDFTTDEDKDLDGVPWCAQDCDDNNPNRAPNIFEGGFGSAVCTDGIDNDCDNRIDFADLPCQGDCIDTDGDGYGVNGDTSCDIPGEIDCDDTNAAVNPARDDANCNGIDEDCVGGADSGYVSDALCGTGECRTNNTPSSCTGGVETACQPGAPVLEGPQGDPTCTGGLDEDCDDLIDGNDPGCNTLCIDQDGDGYGSNGHASCPNGPAVDCDDSNAAAYPGGDDANCNGIDEDCVGGADSGYVVDASCGTGLCNTTNTPSSCTGGVETVCQEGTPGDENVTIAGTCTDGVDNDCDGSTDAVDSDCSTAEIDNDGDGYCRAAACTDGSSPNDCDDTDPNVYPGAPKICDGKDSNCDGKKDSPTDEDKDLDGVPWCAGDCDDNDPLAYPGNTEGPFGDPTCSDGRDNDCQNGADTVDPVCVVSCETGNDTKDGPHVETMRAPGPDGIPNTADDIDHPESNNLLCGKCHGATLQDPIRYACDRCHEAGGTSKAAYPDPWPFGFGSAPDVMVHSSTVVGTKYGAWDMDCLTCHNPHLQEQDGAYGTSYGKYIKEYICFDNPVTAINVEEIVEFTAASGAGSFADGPPYNENICNMCHTQTNHHRRADAAPAPGGQDHNNGQECTTCHPHLDGFAPTGGAPAAPHDSNAFLNDCTLCHVSATDFTTPVPDTKCEQCHTPSGALKGSFPLAPDVLTHSDINNPGSAYTYTTNCVDCHDPMFGSTNQNLIRTTIASSVLGGTIDFTTFSGTGSFADGPPYPDNICNTCHSQTNHHQADGTALGGQDHNNGVDCRTCHAHDNAFIPDIAVAPPHDTISDCSLCHVSANFSDPVPNAACESCHTATGLNKGSYPTAPNVVTHQSRDCIECHDPMFDLGSPNFDLIRSTIAGSITPGSIITFTSYTGINSFGNGPPYNENICDTCHSATDHHQSDGDAPGGQQHENGSDCRSCHDHNDPAGAWAPPAIMAAAPHNMITDCNLCHVGGRFSNPVLNSQCANCHTPTGSAKGSYPTAPNVNTHMGRNCIECHDPMYASTLNFDIVRETIAGSIVPGSTVTFTAYSGAGSFADGPPYNENICETCHSATNHHQSDGVIDPPNTGPQDHENNSDCRTCHDHNDAVNAFAAPFIPVSAPHDAVMDCYACHMGNFADPIPDSQCEQCHTSAGALKGSYPTAPNVLTHTGTTYGLFSITCIECHNPMDDQTNRKHVRSTIAGSITPGSTIVFTSQTLAGSFADGPPYNENVCDTCHSMTNHHQSDGTAPGGQDHENGSNCTVCHAHDNSFQPGAIVVSAPHDAIPDCTLCHVGANFSDPIPNTACESCHTPTGVNKGSYPTAPDVLTHMGGMCIECHDPMNDQTNINHMRSTIAGSIVPGSDIVFTTRTMTGSFADGPPYNENVCNTCHSATNHHQSDGVIDPPNTGPQDHENGSDCTTCHDHNGPLNAFAAPVILVSAPHDAVTDCYACHMGNFADAIPNNKCEQCHTAGGVLKGSYPTAPDVATHAGSSYGPFTRDCVDCHNPMDPQTNQKHVRTDIVLAGGGVNVVYPPFVVGAAPWNGVCETCHTQTNHHQNDGIIDPPNTGTQAHNNAATCTDCHPHLDGFLPTGSNVPMPHDAQLCNTCHVAEPDYAAVIPDSACLMCHDELASPSGNLYQVDNFVGLTTGAAGRPIFGNWTGVAGSDGTNGWMVWTGPTNSAGTGPSAGNPVEYVVLESSASSGGADADPTNGVNVTAGSALYLVSNVIDASMYAVRFAFDWNMNVGNNTDASLHLDAWNGTAWDLDVTGGPINIGNNGDIWVTEGPIDLSAYSNVDFQLRIRYIVGTGTTYQNDVAVDNLVVLGAGGGAGSDLKVMTHADTVNPPRPYTYSNTCVGCHNPMYPQQNLAFIRQTIAGSILGGTIDFTAYMGAGSFADGPPYPDNICNTCHSNTQHHQADGIAPGGQDHNNGQDCGQCHPHLEGFQPQGGCTVCHSQSPPIGSSDPNRRQIVQNAGDGQGDFVKTSHHVTDGTTTEIVTDGSCIVCHDQSNHQSFGDGQSVLLNDQDGGASYTYDGTGASIEGFCVSCHDTDGSLLNGSQPFIVSGDINSPPDVGWSAGVVSHSTFDVCFNCHAQGHGSDFEKILAEDNEPGLCFNCHDADGPASTDISSKFAQQFGHPVTAANSSMQCLECHNPHQAEPGTHTPDGQWYPSAPDANTNLVSGVLSGVMGVEPSPWAPEWTLTDSYTVLDSAEKEYQICFKCHARYSHQYSQDCFMCHPMTWDPDLGAIVAGFKFRSAQREFNINNKSAHSVVVTSNNQSGSYAPKALSTSQMEAPWTNTGNQTMYCSDCHGAENENAGDPRGPHGSDKPFMLKGPNTMWPAGSVRLFSLNDVSNDNSAQESLNTNWRNELFCLNCHDSFPTSNRNTWQNEVHREHDDRDYEPAGGNKRNVYCIACHAIVPHGSHVSRLITYRSELTEYNTYNDVNYNVIEGFRKTSRFSYSEDDCRTVTNLGCDKHDDKVNTWD